MKNKVLSMLVLLIAVATGAWAGNNGYLYLDLSGTTATLKCSNSPGENPFYYQGNWNENQYPGDFDEFKSNFISNCTEITVDASCQNYDGNHYIQLFYDWKALKTINNIGNLKTSSITSMYMMFSGCSSLTTLDLSDWDTSSVGDMGAMFLNCENLTTIYVGSNWSIAAVNSSDNMFLGCEKLPGYNANYDNNATYAHTGAGGYLSVKAATPTSYTVSMKEGTEDATNWTITPNPATAGTQVKATYSGTKRVKSVKAKKVAVPAAAEGHVLSASVVGEIVGSDGNVYAVADKDNLPSGVTAVAMVAYKSATAGSSLAITLADVGRMDWSSAKSTCEGKTAIGGNSWKLPTLDEWKQMFSANGGNEGSCSGLNSAITTAGGTALHEWGDFYWTSSEGGDEGAWKVRLETGVASWFCLDDTKEDATYVRACLAF